MYLSPVGYVKVPTQLFQVPTGSTEEHAALCCCACATLANSIRIKTQAEREMIFGRDINSNSRRFRRLLGNGSQPGTKPVKLAVSGLELTKCPDDVKESQPDIFVSGR